MIIGGIFCALFIITTLDFLYFYIDSRYRSFEFENPNFINKPKDLTNTGLICESDFGNSRDCHLGNDKTKDDSYDLPRYFIYKDQLYYHRNEWNNNKRNSYVVEGVDIKTFKYTMNLGGSFGADINNAYCEAQRVDGSDGKTFLVIYDISFGTFTLDKNNLFQVNNGGCTLFKPNESLTVERYAEVKNLIDKYMSTYNIASEYIFYVKDRLIMLIPSISFFVPL